MLFVTKDSLSVSRFTSWRSFSFSISNLSSVSILTSFNFFLWRVSFIINWTYFLFLWSHRICSQLLSWLNSNSFLEDFSLITLDPFFNFFSWRFLSFDHFGLLINFFSWRFLLDHLELIINFFFNGILLLSSFYSRNFLHGCKYKTN